MKYKPTNILRGRPWLVLLALFAWLMPRQAAARVTYVEEPSNYTVALTGSNVITVFAPLCDFEGTDTWVSKGKVYFEGEGVAKTELLNFYCKDVPWDGYSNSWTEIPVVFSTAAEGYLDIKQGNSSNRFSLYKSNGEVTKQIKREGENLFSFTADWILPYSLLGKKLTFSWEIERNISGAAARKNVTPKAEVITVPQAAEVATPIVSLATLNPNSKGVLELPWFLGAKEISSIRYEYTDASGVRKEVPMSNTVNSSTIQLNAVEPHRGFQIVASYYQEGDKGKYHIENVKTEARNVALIHAPTNLKARSLGGQKAKVELSWTVPYLDDAARREIYSRSLQPERLERLSRRFIVSFHDIAAPIPSSTAPWWMPLPRACSRMAERWRT